MYTSFTIENFRLFDRLAVEPLARVNLIAGGNNAGKTALLEALWLHIGQNNPELAQRINVWRGFPGSEPGEFFADLFRGYQTDLPIKLTAVDKYGSGAQTLTISRQPRTESATPMAPLLSAGPQSRRSQSERVHDTEIVFEYADGSGDVFPSRAWVESAPLPFELPGPAGFRLEGNLAALRVENPGGSKSRKSAIFMQSLGRAVALELAARFGRAEIGGHLADVESVLQLVEPRLQRLVAVPMAEGPALIYCDTGGRIMPIALMGSGFARLLELTLAFSEVSNGAILIDEIENGLHYSVLNGVWKAINDLSRKFNVQVFATTHSYECMEAARDAFKEAEDEDLLIHRISRRDDGVKAATYSFEGLEYNFDLGMELR